MASEKAGIELKDISSEKWRRYRYPNGETVRIRRPVGLNVSASGGHRVVDRSGRGHYLPPGWIHLTWKPRKGQPSIVL